MADAPHYRKYVIIIVCIVLVVAAVAAYNRATSTMEYTVLRGTVRERTDICMVIPELSASRQKWALGRLLADDVPQVQLSAMAAYDLCPPDPKLDTVLERMLTDDSLQGDLRNRAGEILLSREPVPAAVLDYLKEQTSDTRFRRSCPSLTAAYVSRRLQDASDYELIVILSQAADEDDPAHTYIQTVIQDNAKRFAPVRSEFIRILETRPEFSVQQFLFSCLAAIDGSVRGHDAADWIDESFAEAGDAAFHAVEAEWATEIQPNYQIEEWDGVRCLALGPAAGGNRGWLGGMLGSVDIGSGVISLYAPEKGNYRVWARCWFTDKCGNSFGFVMGGTRFAGFHDSFDTLQKWHWLNMTAIDGRRAVTLEKGFHRVRLDAWEDGVYLDRFALLPRGKHPDDLPDPPAVRWDRSLVPSLSFTLDQRGQVRGTRQTAVVWVRRNSPQTKSGDVSLSVGAPFEIISPNPTHIVFGEGSPLARTSFVIELAEDAAAGETLLDATYTDDADGEQIRGQHVISAQFDWLCTGPLKPYDELNLRFLNASTVSDDDLKAHFKPYPAGGHDRYRNMQLEAAYGQLQNVYIYLCTEIEVSKTGTYTVLMNVDDTAMVYLNGRLIASQPHQGPAEGRLMMNTIRLDAGRHRLFVRVYQDDFPDPRTVETRASFNHCIFKLLLRKSRHQHAEKIAGLPWAEEYR